MTCRNALEKYIATHTFLNLNAIERTLQHEGGKDEHEEMHASTSSPIIRGEEQDSKGPILGIALSVLGQVLL